MRWLYRKLNNLSWPTRLPLKCFVLAVVCFVVCFPWPKRLIRHISRWRNPNALIEPNAPALDPLFRELQHSLDSNMTSADTLAAVQRFVINKINYAWDWDTWGMADYIPTVTEAVEKGREDCDGRAVVAASLLARLGYHSELVTDFAHVWVKTDQGELMGPGPAAAIVVTDQGLSVAPGAGWLALRALAYGVAVFPLSRELILLMALWLLIARLPGRFVQALCALGLLVGGLIVFRRGGVDPRDPHESMQLAGLFLLVLAAIWSWSPLSRTKRITFSQAVDGDAHLS